MVKTPKEQVLDQLFEQMGPRLNRVLSAVELCVSEKQFPIVRRIVLDELGRNGVGRDLERILDETGMDEDR